MVKIFFCKDNQDILLSIARNLMNNMSFDWVNIKKAHQSFNGLISGLRPTGKLLDEFQINNQANL